MALPDENKGRCYWLVYLLKLIPVLFIMAVIAWSYYAYVVELCIITISSMVKRILFLVMYHCLTFLFIWSYWRTIFTNIGIVPAKFKLPDSEYDSLVHAEDDSAQQTILQNCSRDLPNANYTLSGGVRYCDKCRSIKPDRSHHCSVCGVCILKMDHHCPWVNNCISFTNYKFFILFLAYGLIYCIYVTLTTMEYFIAFWKGHVVGSAKFHLLFLFFVALMFGVSLISLFSYHCHLVWCNRTTLEAFRPAVFQTGPDKNGFNLGACLNFKEVFGIDPKLWFIPVYTSLGDGITFPVQSRDQPSMYQSMDTTQNSIGDGCSFPTRLVDEATQSLLPNPAQLHKGHVQQDS